MDTKILAEVYERGIHALIAELKLYADEKTIWNIEKEISNSAGNLCLHLIGNLNHFIGSVLGNTGYVRNRDAEFSSKNIPRTELIATLEQTTDVVKKTLLKLTPADLEKEFPLEIMGMKNATAFWLVHFACHLNYHLGQINYHRRLITH
ncbi:MAG: DUF1572 family protein [Bacteroidetes bacterium]|nr:DUF1572 family protein [Bacteroidota bacterium]